MQFIRFTFAAASIAALLSVPAFAGDIEIRDPYFIVSRPGAPNGAIFFEIVNTGTTDDRLVAASTEVAARTELHTHIMTAEGVMQMREVEGGFAVPAGSSHVLARGGDHVMLMGLNRSFALGDTVHLTLTFEGAGDISLEVPFTEGEPAGDGMMNMDHGAMGAGSGAATTASSGAPMHGGHCACSGSTGG